MRSIPPVISARRLSEKLRDPTARPTSRASGILRNVQEPDAPFTAPRGHVLTVEDRAKGGRRRAEKIRERNDQVRAVGTSVRERLAYKVDQELERIWRVYEEALEAEDASGRPDHGTRIRAVSQLLAEAFGKPAQEFRHDHREETRIVFDSPALQMIRAAEPPANQQLSQAPDGGGSD